MLTITPTLNYETINYFTLINVLLYLDYYHKENKKSEQVIDQHTSYRYQGNFYGLLNELKIPAKYHIFILYFNGYTNPVQFDGNRTVIYLPNLTLIDNLLNTFETYS